MAQSGPVALAALSADLARCLAEENANTNLVFSPLSIYAALALLAAGARGDTLDEILCLLGMRSRRRLKKFVSDVVKDALVDQSGSGGPRVVFASGIWSDLTCPLKAAYLSAALKNFKAEASAVDFINNPEAARRQINAWVTQATNNLIPSVFGRGSIKPLTRIVLGNAIYFNGKWDKPFNKKRTTNELFYRLDGGIVHVPFMNSSSAQYIAVHDGFKVLKLGYQMAQAQGNPLHVCIDLSYFEGHSSYTFFSDIDRLCEGVL
jgi:serpin B